MDQTIQPLQENMAMQPVNFSPVLRLLAKVISLIFHPLFIPVYISWFLIYLNPVFPAFSARDKLLLLVRFFVMYTMFPLCTVLLAKGLGFIQSIYLKTQKDRIIPYVACGMYYFWMWYVLKNQSDAANPMVLLSLAIFMASSLGLLANSYIKVSMHAIAVGVMLSFLLWLGFSATVNMGIYISVAILIAGLVCTARLINKEHKPVDIYVGLAIGITGHLIASFFA